MPIKVTPSAGTGQSYGNPWVGPILETAQFPINLTTLSSREVDQYGYLKPGVPLRLVAGVLTKVSAPAQVIFGCTVEATKVMPTNSAGDIAAASVAYEIAVGTIGQINADLLEDILGSAPTADEISAFGAAGSTIKYLT